MRISALALAAAISALVAQAQDFNAQGKWLNLNRFRNGNGGPFRGNGSNGNNGSNGSMQGGRSRPTTILRYSAPFPPLPTAVASIPFSVPNLFLFLRFQHLIPITSLPATLLADT